MASSSSSLLASSLSSPRRHVGVHAEHVSNVSNTEFPGHYPGEDHSWSLAKFKEVRAPEHALCGCFLTGLVRAELESISEEAIATFRGV